MLTLARLVREKNILSSSAFWFLQLLIFYLFEAIDIINRLLCAFV